MPFETSEFRNGLKIQVEGNPYTIVYFQFVKPGKGTAFTRTKLKNLLTGAVIERTFRTGDVVDEAPVEEQPMQFLYSVGDTYTFMNTESYEQVAIRKDDLGQAVYYLTPNTKVMVDFYEHRPVGVELPITVDLKVVETPPGMKGATASNSGKPATLETGLQVTVPQFIEIGEVVRVDTAEGKYLERAK